MQEFLCHQSALKTYGISPYNSYFEPVHLYTFNNNRKCSKPGVYYHLLGKDVKNIYCNTVKSQKILNPTSTLLYYSKYISIQEIIYLGTEMCSRKLTTRDNLLESLNKSLPFYGINKCKKAFKYIYEGSDSPFESLLNAIFVTKHHYGGYNLPVPIMNYRIDLTKEEQEYTGKKYLVVDYYWKDSKLACEFQSTTYHKKGIFNDEARRTVLENHNIKCISVTTVDLINQEKMKFIVKRVSEILNKPLRISSKSFYKHNNLFIELGKRLIDDLKASSISQ